MREFYRKNYWYIIGCLIYSIVAIENGKPLSRVALSFVGALIVLLLFRGLQYRHKNECPRLILGYSRCHGKKCDHSPQAIEDAKTAMNYHIRPPM